MKENEQYLCYQRCYQRCQRKQPSTEIQDGCGKLLYLSLLPFGSRLFGTSGTLQSLDLSRDSTQRTV